MFKRTLCTAWICGFSCVGSAKPCCSDAVLPEGSAPPPSEPALSRPRPSFVWRNWNAVDLPSWRRSWEPRSDNVRAMATSMGLPPVATIPPEMKTRGYITLIRRNWHLLPYDQLLELVEMTPERLAFTLGEDDFLWHKLGQLKPKCERLRLPLRPTRRRSAARPRSAAWSRRILARRLAARRNRVSISSGN